MLRKIAKKILNRISNTPSESTGSPQPYTPPSPKPTNETDLSNIECTAQELRERLEAGEEIIIIDVREAPELESSGIIPGAKHYPLRELPTRWEDFSNANEVVCYCAGGARSYNAAMLLREKGIFNATSVEGGFAKWRAIGGVSEGWTS